MLKKDYSHENCLRILSPVRKGAEGYRWFATSDCLKRVQKPGGVKKEKGWDSLILCAADAEKEVFTICADISVIVCSMCAVC